MKRSLFTILACSFAASLSLAAPQAPVAKATEATELRLEAERTQGTIMNVHIEKKSFVLVADEKELTLTFGESTVFLLDGEEVDAARVLKLGSKVQVSHEGNQALKVEARTKS